MIMQPEPVIAPVLPLKRDIRYGRPEAVAAAVEEAAHRACIHDEIMAMPGGYQAQVKERGLNLSAGQRQRLALARVFLHDPPIVILLKERRHSTTSMNNVQNAIELARGDRTVILVAHRLSTMIDADRIYVLDGGAIVETGTYDELYQKGGIFADLVHCTEAATPESHAQVSA